MMIDIDLNVAWWLVVSAALIYFGLRWSYNRGHDAGYRDGVDEISAEVAPLMAGLRLRAKFAIDALGIYRRQTHQPSIPLTWKSALGLAAASDPTEDEIMAAYRAKAKITHPDHGGSVAAMAVLNVAKDAALRQVRA